MTSGFWILSQTNPTRFTSAHIILAKIQYHIFPTDVIGLGGKATHIAAGVDYTCALIIDNSEVTKLMCWGHNFAGQLGDGTNMDRLAPVYINIFP